MRISAVPQPGDLLAFDYKSASPTTQAFLDDVGYAVLWLWASGTTAQRPRDPVLYQLYGDTTVGGAPFYCSAIRVGATAAQWTQLGGGGGSGTVTSITATLPLVNTPNPITGVGTSTINDFIASGASHARGTVPDPGATPGTTKFLREDATFAVPPGGGSGTVTSITATTPIVVTPSPITGAGDVSHATTAVTPAAYGDASHFTTFTVNATGHLTAAAQVSFPTSGTLQSQAFTASGTWTRPAGVTGVILTMIGGGGGGSSTITAGLGGGGGGAGELVQNFQVNVSGDVTVTVGAKGTGALAAQGSAQAGGNGGDSSFGSQYIARGGFGGGTTGVSGAGGGTGGNASKSVGNPGAAGTLGTQEAPTYFGGGSGGGGGNSTTAAGGAGSAAAAYPTAAAGGIVASSQAGGGGGANTLYGIGAAGGAGGAIGNNAAATSYGAGGGGGGGKVTTTIGGGDGCAGYVLVVWVA